MKTLIATCLTLTLFSTTALAQRASIAFIQSLQLYNHHISPWTYGLSGTFDARNKPIIWTLSINKVPVANQFNAANQTPLSDMQTDSSFGILWEEYNLKEGDIRLGFLFKKSFAKFDIFLGVEGILGITKMEFSKKTALYEMHQYGEYISTAPGATIPFGFRPQYINTSSTESQFFKYGVSPRVGIRHQPSKYITLFANASVDIAKRVARTTIPSPVNPDFRLVNKNELAHPTNIQLTFGVGWRFYQ